LPFTFKDELNGASHEGDFAANLTYPIERYVRFHRTSGTRGRPLVVLDTDEDWQWWVDNWQFVLDAAEVQAGDRALMAFSYGPFIGFWSAGDAITARGALMIPGGGTSTAGRLELLRSSRATVLCCTPSYALHMAEVAEQNRIATRSLGIRRVIVAGEPGGSITAIRDRIEDAWNAKVIDHSGATEVGPWGYADNQRCGLHVIESAFLAEFLSVETGGPAGEGELSELVLTTLGRVGSPVIRYRTGDLVRPSWDGEGPNRFVLLKGGVLGRGDDMLVIRGVNIFPSSIEQILHSFPEIVEYRMTARKEGHMDDLQVEIEDRLDEPTRVARELQLRLGLRVGVRCVPLGSLPRFESKGKRFVDLR
jgi:phenylacetate-CoA ligase